MEHVHRRGLLVLGASGLAAGAAGLVTAQDYSGPEREAIAAALKDIAANWEHASPADALAALGVLERRLGAASSGSPDSDWLALYTRTLIMAADAGAAAGRPEEAARTAAHARYMAAQIGDPVLRAHAQTIEAELYAGVAPKGAAAIEMFSAAGRLAGTSPAGVTAATLEANARAARGDDPQEILRILQRAQAVQHQLPDSAGDARWTVGHMYAFGASALVRSGELGAAGEWLVVADELTEGQPGIRSAVQLYRSHHAARAGQWDAAYSYTDMALTVSAQRGIPAWLSTGVGALAKQASGRGGNWGQLRARLV